MYLSEVVNVIKVPGFYRYMKRKGEYDFLDDAAWSECPIWWSDVPSGRQNGKCAWGEGEMRCEYRSNHLYPYLPKALVITNR
jgi:hypothetical protein